MLASLNLSLLTDKLTAMLPVLILCFWRCLATDRLYSSAARFTSSNVGLFPTPSDAVIICVTPTSCTQTSRDCATDGRRLDVQVSRRSHPETWLTSLPKWQKLGFRRKLPVPPHFKSHAMDRNC